MDFPPLKIKIIPRDFSKEKYRYLILINYVQISVLLIDLIKVFKDKTIEKLQNYLYKSSKQNSNS